MTARAAVALALAAAAMLAALVARVMAWSVLAGTLLACVLIGVLVLYAAYRLIATGKGAHVAPHGWAEATERLALPCEQTIPRAPTEHAPPWQPAPVPVIEPAAITSGPPPAGPDPWSLDPGRVTPGPVTAEEARSRLGPEPEALAIIIIAGTRGEDGQVRTGRVELLPPVEALLGHASTGDAVAAMSAGWHSVESLFNGHHAREVRALTDGAS